MAQRRVLVIDDNLEMASTIADYLRGQGFEADPAGGGVDGIARFAANPADVVLTDLRMQEVDGLDVLEAVRRIDPDTPVVIMTAFGAIDSAVEAIRRGAYHYVTKPFKMDVVRLLLDRACSERSLRLENERLRRTVEDRFSFASLVGRSTAMQELYALIERVAMVPMPALILGETGTGKELVARAIHAHGPRAKAAFVAVNCAALPEALLESELFGHARGAFTGATQVRRGLFVEADGGTLLLDEIGDMPLTLQAKLLRILESGEIRAVGSDSMRRCDVRVLAATHRVLEDLVREGKFREDLYYRLRVLTVSLRPLRERREDLPLLVDHFLARAKQQSPGSGVQGFTPEAMQVLSEHSWPGNVRELEHLIQSVVVTNDAARVDVDALLPSLREVAPDRILDRARRGLWPLRELEQEYIAWVLEHTGGNKTRAAEILGIDPSTLYRREGRVKS
jgi:two-component system response regulator HydG